MNLLEKICKELGVEVGEKWLGNDGYYYEITEEGLIGFYYPTSDDRVILDIDIGLWVNVMLGELKPVWKPRKGEDYSIPDTSEEKLCRSRLWGGFKDEEMLLERGLIFKTEEEAIECANKMLESIRK